MSNAPGLALSATWATTIDDMPEEHEHRDGVHVDEHHVVDRGPPRAAARLERAQVQLGRDPGGEDRAERAGVLEERRYEHEERREREERLESLLDGQPGHEVDHSREHEHRERLEHDTAQDRQPGPDRERERAERHGHAEDRDRPA